MNTAIVEAALRTTYHLAGTDAARLRKLTRQSGLEAENVVSRLAIVRSLTADRDQYGDYVPSTSGRQKEMKGVVLLGRPRQAALLVALVLERSRLSSMDLRCELTWHWGRGLRLLDDAAVSGDVLHALAAHLTDSTTSSRSPGHEGLGGALRDELGAVVGRRFPRWPNEVRRLVAMAARLDLNQLDAVAERIAAELDDPAGSLNEITALHILREKWGLNRLGLNANDRRVLQRLLASEVLDHEDRSIPFLAALGLVVIDSEGVRLSTIGRRLGSEAILL